MVKKKRPINAVKQGFDSLTLEETLEKSQKSQGL